MRGWFVAFEGGEASGKSTQAARFAERIDALLTREPGGTPLGERVRELVLDPVYGTVDPRAEALLMAAARAQHVTDVIRPALVAGRHVVTDRYIGSSLAYQGHARGLGVELVAALSSFATGGLQPDVVVLLEVDDGVASARLARGPLDRLEREGIAFHAAVRAGFSSLAAADAGRWVVVDGGGTVEEVAAQVADAVAARLPDLVGT